MAQRRMFSKSITNSSQFLMMPQSSQNLYFHFGMNADDDGFCEHFTVMRMTESKPDDLKVLQAKGFVTVFDEKVLVITDWKENNYLRSDRYTPSKYLEVYKNEIKRIVATSGIPDVNQMATQVSIELGKVRSGYEESPREISSRFFSEEDNEEQESVISMLVENGVSESVARAEIKKFISYWTELNSTGKKQRWEMEKTFEIKRRLTTWFAKASQFSGFDKQKSKVAFL